MNNIQYQAKKKARAKTNPKNIIPKKYHIFLNVFLKIEFDIFPLHQKYNYKIHQEEKQKPGHVLL